MSKQGLDKNSIIGLVLIGVILLVFSYVTRPTEAEIEASRNKQIAQEKAKSEQIDNTSSISKSSAPVLNSTIANDSINTISGNDSLKNIEQFATFGPFSKSSTGENKHFVIYYTLVIHWQ